MTIGTRRKTTSVSATASRAGSRSSTAREASSQHGPSSTPSTTRPYSKKLTHGEA